MAQENPSRLCLLTAATAAGDERNGGGSSFAELMDLVNIDAYSVSLPQPTVSRKTTKMMLVDSGASHHCVREKSLFTTFKPGKHIFRIADNKLVPAVGKCTVSVNAESSLGKTMSIC